ncbi:hypothetical protein GCM10011517_07260 [Actibacterium pelagium]|uniref:Uncharacterized protein n=2 Tax=Actibacterium pelagium TaxID=2029103 RepID=A0A917ABZ1_9RHOB|nr:hypothetical protein [Actibacterium pelagium]GGE42193.1 hypothetical protein GCM10011517_07260 [Actibacterium pelagium]
MGRLLKILFFLLLLAFVGLIGFAYLGDLRPSQKVIEEPVKLDVD